MYKTTNMTATKHIPLFILAVVVIILLLTIPLLVKRNTQTTEQRVGASGAYTQKVLETIEVKETVDLNTDPARFQLHVQHEVSQPETDSPPFAAIPQKLILIDKLTQTKRIELALMPSSYPNECAAMHQDLSIFKKWNTDWFSLDELAKVDPTYTSKLTDRYTVQIIYEEGENAQTYVSTNNINGVCYQITQATPVTPTQEEELPEE